LPVSGSKISDQGAPGAPLVTSPAPPVAKRGFTLVELIVMITLISILAFAALGRMANLTVNLGAQADQLAADIRYVQSLSQTSALRHCVAFTATDYRVSSGNTCIGAVVMPDAANPVPLAAGITHAPITTALLVFNTLGQPFTDAAATTPLAAEAVITLNGAGESRSVRVTPQTGRVRVQ